MHNPQKKRFWEIDTTRGLAVIAMIIFHTVFILAGTGLADINLYTGFWWIFPRVIAAVFLVVVGVCLGLSYRKAAGQVQPGRKQPRPLLLKFLGRGSILFGIGLIITLITWRILPGRMVFFGILHLIGSAIILSYPLIRFKYINLVAGILVLAAGLVLGRIRFSFPGLLWLGLRPVNYFPVDYLPLLPWYSFVLFGLFLSSLLYPGGSRCFSLPQWDNHLPVRGLSFLGRHSLVIYLAHLPLLYGLAYFWKVIHSP